MCGRCCAWGGRSFEQYCGSLRTVPRRIVLDIDDTFDRVHGGQQLRLFNAYYDDYGFQPIVVFDGEGRFVTTLLRPGRRPSGVEICGFVRRLIGAIRAHWPKVEYPTACRQSLRGPGSVRRAPSEPGRLDLRPGPQRRALPPYHDAGGEHRRALQGGARAR